MYEDALVTLNKDKKLKKIISSVGECKIRTISNPFEALIEAIITQQISDSAGKAISLRFKNLFGTKYPTANDLFSPLDPAQPCVAWLANWMPDGYPGTPWQWYQEHMQSPFIRSGDSWIHAPFICPCFKPDGSSNDSPVILHTESTFSNHWLCPVCGQTYHRHY